MYRRTLPTTGLALIVSLPFLLPALLIAGCADIPPSQDGGTIGLGPVLYFRQFFPPGGTVLVEVKEKGFTFSVTAGSLYSCDAEQGVWQAFSYAAFVRWYNFNPQDFSGCGILTPAAFASGDARMLERMNMDPRENFQFVFDKQNTFNLPRSLFILTLGHKHNEELRARHAIPDVTLIRINFFDAMETGMSINKIRGSLYFWAKLLGDLNAVLKGKIGKRIVRRLAGRFTGRWLGKLFR